MLTFGCVHVEEVCALEPFIETLESLKAIEMIVDGAIIILTLAGKSGLSDIVF